MLLFGNYSLSLPKVTGAGFFVSKGSGRHPERIIKDYEIIFVRRGTLEIEEDGVRYSISQGTVLFLEPGLLHRGLETYPANLNFYWLHFVLPKNVKCGLKKKTFVRHPEKLTLIFREISSVWQSGKLTDLEGGAQVLRIFEELMQDEGEEREHINYALAVKCDNYIRSHLKKSRAEISQDLDYNPDYLGRVYRSTYGKTITDAINYYRTERAKILLGETSFNVEKISEEVGFSDSSYFRRVFRQFTGVSPLQFRHKFSPVFEIND